MHIKLETERLYLREFTLDDAAMVFEMHQDPAITRYTGDPLPWDSIVHTEKILTEAILPQYQHNIGRWAVHLKATDEFIGWCGLKNTGEEIDLGYRYIQKYWGNRYALEAAKAVLDYGVKLQLPNIIGRASVANVASVKILAQIGLTFDAFYMDEDTMEESVRYIYKA
ncbi:MAG: GNAT family N-acetyltransferase [Bacteroidota bacterium]